MSGKDDKKSTDKEDLLSTETRKKGRKVHLVTLIFYLLLVAVLTILAGIGIWSRKVYGPMNLSTATPSALKNWIMLRRFDKETPEIRRKLLLKYVEVYGPEAPGAEPNKACGFVKNLSRKYILERQEQTRIWEQNRFPLDKCRIEYRVKPQTDPAGSKYILPRDIVADESLKKSEQEVKAIAPATRMEANIRYLVREWFLWKMEEYAKTDDSKKLDFLLKTVQEINYWQEFYIESLVALDLPRLETLELYREFMLTIYWWYEISDDTESLARLLWFKDALVSVMTAQQTGRPPQAPVYREPNSGLLNRSPFDLFRFFKR